MAHNKSLYQLREFKLAIGLPLLGAALSASWIAWVSFVDGNYEVCGSAECINNALGMLKLPLGILALIFPSVALVATQHRSVQTAEQISQAAVKNSFENCLKHRDLFCDFIEELEQKYGCSFREKQNLYTKIYPENDFVKFSYYADFEDFFALLFEKIEAFQANYKSSYESNELISSLFCLIDDQLNFSGYREIDSRDFENADHYFKRENGDFDLKKLNEFIEVINRLIDEVFRFSLELDKEAKATSFSGSFGDSLYYFDRARFLDCFIEKLSSEYSDEEIPF